MRAAYGYDVKAASDEVGFDCSVLDGAPCPSMAQQHFKDECDINTIVARFNLTGQLPENVGAPTYQDFEGIFDYQSALNAVMAAEDSFMQMPADIRSRFHNNPQSFVEFCSNDQNHEEMRKMGLTVSKPTEMLSKADHEAAVAAAVAAAQKPPPRAGQAFATDPNA